MISDGPEIIPLEQVHGNPSMPVSNKTTACHRSVKCLWFAATVSIVEPKNIKEAMADSAWIEAMQDELHQFDRLKVWELVDKPFGKMVIKLKWLWKNKKDEDQTVFATKAHLLHKVMLRRGNFEKHNMDNCHSIGTPLATKPKLDIDLSGEPVDQSDYRSKIGSLMYLTSSRPDLVQAVCYCARYQARPTQKHLKETGYHAGCLDTRKSTSEGIHFLVISCKLDCQRKQNCIAMSSAEAEYVALSASCAQVMWMRTQLQDYGFNYNKIPLYVTPLVKP
ncbi:hypothetical protein Tco_1201062 [Tanacetum coccineum]